MRNMTTKRAVVVNGNKAYRHRVFIIKGARIIKSWNTNEYLKLSLEDIRGLLAYTEQDFRGRHG